MAGIAEGRVGGIILQIKLAQWRLIKIVFPMEGSPNLPSIYVSTTTSQTVLIAKRYCASQNDLNT